MTSLSRSLIFLSAAICMLSLPPAHSMSNGPGFQRAARRVLSTLATCNYKVFDSLISKDGLYVVRREDEWKQHSTDAPVASESPGQDLSLRGLPVATWSEEYVEFDKSEIDHDENSDLVSVLTQFRHLLQNTMDGYHESIVASLNTTDTWELRRLGPAICGKIASNCWWYIYLKPENGKWRIWKMEFDVH
jgi:hypothetical protein